MSTGYPVPATTTASPGMTLHGDFSRPVRVHSDLLDWRASPTPGVERRMLERLGDEVARATTIVRYAPGSRFPAHAHRGGEEFIVLAGVFQDEHGDYPVGTYVRNPPGTQHTPGSAGGCTIFVKLWQFDPTDRHPVRVDMTTAPGDDEAGVHSAMLHSDARECVRYQVWAPHTRRTVALPDGGEVLLLAGHLQVSAQPAIAADATDAADTGDDTLRPLSWLRLPCASTLTAVAGAQGARLWMKTGHLPYARPPEY